MGIFMCKRCGSVVETFSNPSGSGCQSGIGHQWYKLTSDGSLYPKPGLSPYNCMHCGITIYSKTLPTGTGCPKNAGHSWRKLS